VRFDPYGAALRALQARPGEWHDAGQVPSSTPGTLRRRGCQIAARPGDGKGSVRLYVLLAGRHGALTARARARARDLGR
jgi:hypothetical protein